MRRVKPTSEQRQALQISLRQWREEYDQTGKFEPNAADREALVLFPFATPELNLLNIFADFAPDKMDAMLDACLDFRERRKLALSDTEQKVLDTARSGIDAARHHRLDMEAQLAAGEEIEPTDEWAERLMRFGAASFAISFLSRHVGDQAIDWFDATNGENREGGQAGRTHTFWVAELYRHWAQLSYVTDGSLKDDKTPTALPRGVLPAPVKSLNANADFPAAILELTRRQSGTGGTGAPLAFRLWLAALYLIRLHQHEEKSQWSDELLSVSVRVQVRELLPLLWVEPPHSVNRWYPQLVRAAQTLDEFTVSTEHGEFDLVRISGLFKGRGEHDTLTLDDHLTITGRFTSTANGYILAQHDDLLKVSCKSFVATRLYLALLTSWSQPNKTLLPGRKRRGRTTWFHTNRTAAYPHADPQRWFEQIRDTAPPGGTKKRPVRVADVKDALKWLADEQLVKIERGRVVPPNLEMHVEAEVFLNDLGLENDTAGTEKGRG